MAGQEPKRFLPILDEAGTGSLQAVLDGEGNLVERVLYADAYGDEPRYLQGGVVERITVQRLGSSREITVSFTEQLDKSTIALGLRLAAIADGAILRTASVTPELVDATSVRWTLGDTEWASFIAAPDGTSVTIQIAAGDALRFTGWGNATVQAPAAWEATLGRAASSPEWPFIKTVAVAELDTTATVYDIPDLYLVARRESVAKLHFDFHALPFRDPALEVVYVRARWYDPSTASFLTPDPMGYRDSSNLYAYAKNDPVNFSDPSGRYAESVWDATSLGLGLYSISRWDEKTTFWDKVVDVVGVTADTVALALPAIPGGAGAAIRAYRAGDMASDAYRTGRTLSRVIEGTQAVDRAINEIQGGYGIWEDYRKGDFGVGTLLNVAQVTLGVRTTAKEGKRMVEAFRSRPPKKSLADGASSDMPCPVCPCACLAAGTEVQTPTGPRAIETLRVGDRVTTTNVEGSKPDGWTSITNPEEWRVVTMVMPNPDAEGDVIEISTIRNIEWLKRNDARVGHWVQAVIPEIGMAGVAQVQQIESVVVSSAPGRLVLSTFAHYDQIFEIHLEGLEEVLGSTPWHRFFSEERNRWVQARHLVESERIRIEGTSARVLRLHPSGRARVFEISVENDHSYLLGESGVLSHNSGLALNDYNVLVNELEVRLYRGRALGGVNPYYIADPRLVVDMPFVGQSTSGVNKAGWLRNSEYYWQVMLSRFPEAFSERNRSILAGDVSPRGVRVRAPTNDQEFRSIFAQYDVTGLRGESMHHHHIGRGGQAFGLPVPLHQGTGGFANIHSVENALGILDEEARVSDMLERLRKCK